jgi:hypothetical protein
VAGDFRVVARGRGAEEQRQDVHASAGEVRRARAGHASEVLLLRCAAGCRAPRRRCSQGNPVPCTPALRSVNACTRRCLAGVPLPEGARVKVQPFGSYVSGLSTWNR